MSCLDDSSVQLKTNHAKSLEKTPPCLMENEIVWNVATPEMWRRSRIAIELDLRRDTVAVMVGRNYLQEIN